MFAILAFLLFAAGFVYAAGAAQRSRRALPSESGNVSLEAKLLASAAQASDKLGAVKDRSAMVAKRNAFKLLAATAQAAANGATSLAVKIEDQRRREAFVYQQVDGE